MLATFQMPPIPIPVRLMNDIYHWIIKRWLLFKMQTLNSLGLKISTQNYIVHKNRCNVTTHWIAFSSSRPMGIFAKWKSSIPIVTCSLPFTFPFWHTYVPIPKVEIGIPFSCTCLLWRPTPSSRDNPHSKSENQTLMYYLGFSKMHRLAYFLPSVRYTA